MNPTNLMKIIGDAEDDYILSALESRKKSDGETAMIQKSDTDDSFSDDSFVGYCDYVVNTEY